MSRSPDVQHSAWSSPGLGSDPGLSHVQASARTVLQQGVVAGGWELSGEGVSASALGGQGSHLATSLKPQDRPGRNRLPSLERRQARPPFVYLTSKSPASPRFPPEPRRKELLLSDAVEDRAGRPCLPPRRGRLPACPCIVGPALDPSQMPPCEERHYDSHASDAASATWRAGGGLAQTSTPGLRNKGRISCCGGLWICQVRER